MFVCLFVCLFVFESMDQFETPFLIMSITANFRKATALVLKTYAIILMILESVVLYISSNQNKCMVLGCFTLLLEFMQNLLDAVRHDDYM